MKQVIMGGGGARTVDVPAPTVQPGCVLVRTSHSCISTGTELAGFRATRNNPLIAALKDPQLRKKGLDLVRRQGIMGARSVVRAKLETARPAGYTLSGTVLAVGKGVVDIQPGDRVACAGAQAAHHAQVVNVPYNLVVRVPDNVTSEDASTVALGAIALHGVHRTEPVIGETVIVVGLGVLGQITCQILKAAGVRVIALDLDRTRVELARDIGGCVALCPDDDVGGAIARETNEFGADAVIVTASSPSDEVISKAFGYCRTKGRVVIVGDVGLGIRRSDIYEKELEIRISTSYGPGRYDPRYEEGGLDYPIGYVRWTERRNMAAYLQLISEEKVKVTPFVERIFAITEATAAYEFLAAEKPLLLLLDHASSTDPLQSVIQRRVGGKHEGKVGLTIIGAGDFVKAMHLPTIKSMSDRVEIRGVVTRSGLSADSMAKAFDAAWAGTSIEDALNDEQTDAVLIATRHDSHAELALAALRAGKHVFLEKPMGLTEAEIDAFEEFYDGRDSAPLLLVGFNRRFSPTSKVVMNAIRTSPSPAVINYRMNAGLLPRDHWVHGPQGGGRNLGEACHIYDLFTAWTDSRMASMTTHVVRPRDATIARNNFIATVTFDDGSIASLTYTDQGNSSHPKEEFEVFVNGHVIVGRDYKEVTSTAGTHAPFKGGDKGHAACLAAFIDVVLGGGDWPAPLEQQLQASRMALLAERQMSGD